MKRFPSSLFLFALSAQFVGAVTVNVADHGIVPGKDVSAQVNQLLETLKGQKDVTLYFPKGQYEFYPEQAVKMYRAVTNHDNSVKPMAFPLFGFEDFTLDGGGSTFMFHGRICPITLEGSRGVTLKDFSIDWETPFHHELRVVESDAKKKSFVVEIAPMKYGFDIKDGTLLLNHYDWQDEVGQNVAFDPATRAPAYMTKDYAYKRRGAKARKVGENRVLLENATKVAPPIGTVILAYGSSPGGNRFAQAIHVSNSKDTLIKNVSVFAAGGMGLIAERSENIHLDAFVVTTSQGRMLSTRADATHFLGCKGEVRIENCLFENMADDGINVHGAYVKVEAYQGNKTFLCEISHIQQAGLIFTEPGDRVLVTSRETLLPLFETTVTAVEILDEKQVLVTVSEVPDTMPTDVLSMENLTWYPDLIVKHNTIRNNRARSALITTKGKVLVEDNFFSSQMHGILIEGDNNSWYESGAVQDITICNNTFENIGYGSGDGYPLFAAPLFTPEQRIGDDHYHRNIRFTNNRLKSFNGLLVHAFNVKDLQVTGNIVELDDAYPEGGELPSVDLNYSHAVTIEGNEFKGFKRSLKMSVSKDSSQVIFKQNQGIAQ